MEYYTCRWYLLLSAASSLTRSLWLQAVAGPRGMSEVSRDVARRFWFRLRHRAVAELTRRRSSSLFYLRTSDATTGTALALQVRDFRRLPALVSLRVVHHNRCYNISRPPARCPLTYITTSFFSHFSKHLILYHVFTMHAYTVQLARRGLEMAHGSMSEPAPVDGDEPTQISAVAAFIFFLTCFAFLVLLFTVSKESCFLNFNH